MEPSTQNSSLTDRGGSSDPEIHLPSKDTAVGTHRVISGNKMESNKSASCSIGQAGKSRGSFPGRATVASWDSGELLPPGLSSPSHQPTKAPVPAFPDFNYSSVIRDRPSVQAPSSLCTSRCGFPSAFHAAATELFVKCKPDPVHSHHIEVYTPYLADKIPRADLNSAGNVELHTCPALLNPTYTCPCLAKLLKTTDTQTHPLKYIYWFGEGPGSF